MQAKKGSSVCFKIQFTFSVVVVKARIEVKIHFISSILIHRSLMLLPMLKFPSNENPSKRHMALFKLLFLLDKYF